MKNQSQIISNVYLFLITDYRKFTLCQDKLKNVKGSIFL